MPVKIITRKKMPPSRKGKPPQVKSLVRELQEARRQFIEKVGTMSDAQIIGGLLFEAHNEGIGSSHAARVSAWVALADIKGMRKRAQSIESGFLPSDALSNEELAKRAGWERDTSMLPKAKA